MTELKEIIEGIEYHLFTDCQGTAIQIKDLDLGEIVAMIGYPSAEQAQEAYKTTVAMAWQCAAMKNRSEPQPQEDSI